MKAKAYLHHYRVSSLRIDNKAGLYVVPTAKLLSKAGFPKGETQGKHLGPLRNFLKWVLSLEGRVRQRKPLIVLTSF